MTIVITGASSGIGLATALRLSTPDARLVLISRNARALEDAARQCREKGAQVLIMAGDMGSEIDVERIGRAAVETFGDIDVWVNNAGVSVYGDFLSISNQQFQKVIQTNLMGYVHGARVALEQFHASGNGGVLINVASGFGTFPSPYAGSYVASKYAVRGLSASLRQELYDKHHADIHVCTVIPATIDTPFYRHAANVSGKKLQAIPPVYPAEMVATAISRLITHPKAETVVGGVARLTSVFHRLSSYLTEYGLARYIPFFNYAKAAAPITDGDLFQASTNTTAQVSGDWPTKSRYIFNAALMIGVGAAIAGAYYAQRKKS